MIHLKYLWYVLRHKWHVFRECCKLGVPWLGVVHDLSKFRPDEWVPYARYFYGTWPAAPSVWRFWPSYTGPTKQSVADDFDLAWLLHQHRNPHHWQYWLLVQDDDIDKVLPMPDRYRREMLADWRGASLAANGEDNTPEWYAAHKDKMQLHPETRRWIEQELARGGRVVAEVIRGISEVLEAAGVTDEIAEEPYG